MKSKKDGGTHGIFATLPDEIVEHIYEQASTVSLRSLFSTCRFFSASAAEKLNLRLSRQWKIFAGGSHSVFLHLETGRLFGTGSNAYGQLGNENTGDVCFREPVEIHLPDNNIPVDVATGAAHTLVLCDNGNLFGFGDNQAGQLGLDALSCGIPQRIVFPDADKVRQVVTSGNYDCHTVVLCENNRVYGFGCNHSGQLGSDSPAKQITPVQIPLPEDVIPEQVVIGGEHTFILSSQGLYGFGNNSIGELMPGNPCKRQTTATLIPLPDNIQVKQISAGYQHTLILSQSGRVFGSGYNSFGQVGTGKILCENKYIRELQEISYPSEDKPLGILASMFSSFIIHKKQIYFFGSNDPCKRKSIVTRGNDQTIAENGRQYYDRVIKPALIELQDKIPVQVASSGDHTFILCADNTLFRFGNPRCGQLGVEPFRQINILEGLQKMIEKEQLQSEFKAAGN